jgi:hypothetical protein
MPALVSAEARQQQVTQKWPEASPVQRPRLRRQTRQRVRREKNVDAIKTTPVVQISPKTRKYTQNNLILRIVKD